MGDFKLETGGFCPRGIWSYGGFSPGGLYPVRLYPGGFNPGGFSPRPIASDVQERFKLDIIDVERISDNLKY